MTEGNKLCIQDDSSRIHLTLFLSGDSPNSRLARENLHALCGKARDKAYQIEIVDVFKCPQRALDASVFLTPALHVRSEDFAQTIYGNLSNHDILEPVFGGHTRE